MDTTETQPPEPLHPTDPAPVSAVARPLPTLQARLFLFVALAAGALLLYGPYLLGNLPVGADNTLFYAPFFAMRWQGGPPLWSPYSLSGTGLLDNLQAALLYPPRWPFYFIADWRDFFGIFIFLHYALALGGMVGLLRALRLRTLAVLGGALLFVIGGHLAGRVINLTIFMGCCWLPWLLWGAVGRRLFHGVLTTLALAMIALIGSPHLIFYGLIAWAILFFWCTLLPCKEHTSNFESAIRHPQFAILFHRAANLLLAFLLAAPTLLPGVLRSQVSIRTQATVESNLADSATWGEISHLLLGGNLTSIYPEFIDKCVYVGPVALLLILWLACRPASWRDRRFLGGLWLVLIGLYFALGRTVGLDHVLPFIPVVRNLAGASRALVVTAAGLALLLALALDALAARPTRRLGLLAAGLALVALGTFWGHARDVAPTSADVPTLAGYLVRAWFFAPCALDAASFPLLDAAAGLLAAAVILIALPPARDRLRLLLLCGLLTVLCWHFAPRVLPPTERAPFFDPPRQVAWLQSRQARSAAAPFRVAGFDPLRLHDGEFLSPWKFVYLMPNVAAIYGLEDINGFDPLIRLDYLDLFQRTSGRAPFNDPIRNLDLGRPDRALFDTLGVRYMIGCPRDRRLTTVMLNLGVDPAHGLDVRTAEVRDWHPGQAEGPLTHWLIVSSLNLALNVPLGEEVARLHIEADEGAFDFPIRNGLETADYRAFNYAPLFHSPRFRVAGNVSWWNNVFLPDWHYRIQFDNYRAVIPFGRPLHVRRAEWRLLRTDIIFNVAAQACRYAPAPDDPWALRLGTPDDLAPVYEYLRVPPRAVLVGRPPLPGAANSDRVSTAEEIQLDPAQLNPPPEEGAVRWLGRGNHSMTLSLIAGRPSLLVLREMWDAGWQATVGGAPAPVLRVNGLLRGVRVPAGQSTVTLVYRPRLPLALLALAAAALSLYVAVLLWVRRRRASAG